MLVNPPRFYRVPLGCNFRVPLMTGLVHLLYRDREKGPILPTHVTKFLIPDGTRQAQWETEMPGFMNAPITSEKRLEVPPPARYILGYIPDNNRCRRAFKMCVHMVPNCGRMIRGEPIVITEHTFYKVRWCENCRSHNMGVLYSPAQYQPVNGDPPEFTNLFFRGQVSRSSMEEVD